MTSHYFSRDPDVSSEPRRVPLSLPDLDLVLTTDRGVFGADAVDPGTRFLLLDAPAPPPDARHLLDLGCGYGPIAVTLAHRCPAATVWAVDVNARAVDLCRTNAAAAAPGRVRAEVVEPDAPLAPLPADVLLDGIWSNPPVRIGKQPLHDLLTTALDRLAPAAHAYLVVHKHLGSDSLQRWLTDRGWTVDRLGSRQGYRLLDVARTGAGDR